MTSAVILAGGLGTRLRSTVPDLPKPMAPINGRPFLEYLLDYWIDQGIDHFVLSVGYLHNIILNHFGKVYKGACIEYALETKPLGTGGGLLLACSLIDSEDSFLLLNGDTYFAVDLKKLIDFSFEQNTDWCLSLFRAQEDDRYMGLDLDDDGRIKSLRSDSLCKFGALANGGAYWVNRIALIQANYRQNDSISLENDILPFATESGQSVYGLEFSGTFIDIGVPNDFIKAQKLPAFSGQVNH